MTFIREQSLLARELQTLHCAMLAGTVTGNAQPRFCGVVVPWYWLRADRSMWRDSGGLLRHRWCCRRAGTAGGVKSLSVGYLIENDAGTVVDEVRTRLSWRVMHHVV